MMCPDCGQTFDDLRAELARAKRKLLKASEAAEGALERARAERDAAVEQVKDLETALSLLDARARVLAGC